MIWELIEKLQAWHDGTSDSPKWALSHLEWWEDGCYSLVCLDPLDENLAIMATQLILPKHLEVGNGFALAMMSQEQHHWGETHGRMAF